MLKLNKERDRINCMYLQDGRWRYFLRCYRLSCYGKYLWWRWEKGHDPSHLIKPKDDLYRLNWELVVIITAQASTRSKLIWKSILLPNTAERMGAWQISNPLAKHFSMRVSLDFFLFIFLCIRLFFQNANPVWLCCSPLCAFGREPRLFIRPFNHIIWF